MKPDGVGDGSGDRFGDGHGNVSWSPDHGWYGPLKKPDRYGAGDGLGYLEHISFMALVPRRRGLLSRPDDHSHQFRLAIESAALFGDYCDAR